MPELHDIADLDSNGLPSNASLLKATLLALSIAGVLLVTAILPAEYGIDPTGLGGRLGLKSLHAAKSAHGEATSGPLLESAQAYRNNKMTIVLEPHKGAEIKAVMDKGQRFVFEWEVEGGAVDFDMHGDHADTKDAFTSFLTGSQQSKAAGTFEAPFKGAHGWYWKNKSAQPLKVHLKVSGFYETLYMP
jgi:hypothetical protein